MITQGTGGSLVALASVDGFTGSRYHAAYGVAKAGVISLAKTFAEELGRYGIRVNAVAPGNVGTGNEDQPEGPYAVDRQEPARSHPGEATSPTACSSSRPRWRPASPARP